MNYTKVILISRNVLFTKKTEDLLKDLQERAETPKVKKWVKSNFRNWLINEYEGSLIEKAPSGSPDWLKKALERGDEVYKVDISNEDREDFLHWIDYLNTLNEKEDLSRISVPQLRMKVKEWDENLSEEESEAEGTKVIHKYSDGFSWKEVFSEEALEREGELMQHCAGSYYKKVKNGDTTIFSLRDPNNNPHVTIEYFEGLNMIEQIKGKQNEPPVEEYHPYVRDFIENGKIKVVEIAEKDLNRMGLLYVGKKLYSLNSLPDGFEIKGNLILEENKSLTRLPNNLKVKGNLDLSYTKNITELPEGLKVGGTLWLLGSSVSKLPKGLKVGGLDLRESKVTELPEGLKVGGTLNLRESKVTELPEGLKVGGTLDLLGSSVSKLPKGLEVGGLKLKNSKVTELPEDLKVNSSLDINSSIKKLSRGLKVKGVLNIRGSLIKVLPEDIEAETLNLLRSKVTKLSRGLRLEYLDLSLTEVAELSEDTVIKDFLNVTECGITELPRDLRVGGNLYAPKHIKIPNSIKVGGKIEIDD